MLTEAQKEEFHSLFKKYLQQTASPEEIVFLEAYYKYFDREEKQSLKLDEEDLRRLEARMYNKIHQIINRNEAPVRKIKPFFSNWRKIAAALILIFSAAASVYLIQNSADHHIIAKNQAPPKKDGNDLPPGGSRAILTLADGSTIVLDSSKTGQIASQGNSNILRPDSGVLAYHLISEKEHTASPAEIKYNTIATPNGGLYQVVLSDGSKVWLNAASSLRFPASFSGNDREVELKGEAYFEISKQTRISKSGVERIPFVVHTNAGDVQVLGTHFNVNAYANESSVKTTLLEGSVKVNYMNSSLLLSPGMQSQVDGNGSMRLEENVNLEEIMAWKNGMFQFRSADIETIMRQVARWYDVDVEYAGKVNEKFYMETPRNRNASELFKILETTRAVQFQIKGKKVIVQP
jgi:ferric-dicitrate binding protein FerR (iron transport regulator)